jgi:ABC-type nitrate/sulfonate/bicarbonate transport system substrate-binding protein
MLARLMARATAYATRSADLRRLSNVAACALALLAAPALAGCGAAANTPQAATLMLDFTPNAVHAGIYSAVRRGYDRDEGVRLDVLQPSASTDSARLLLAGRVDLAILDIHDLAIADADGQEIVGVLALVARPLAAVIAQPHIATPRELEGRTVGVTGVPSDEAVLDSVLVGAGASPRRVHRVNIGFEAVPSLLAGHVDAATAFWDVEGVALSRARPGTREFRVDEYGAPAYPELVVCVTRKTLQHRAAFVENALAAIARGYQVTLADPHASTSDMVAEVPGVERGALEEQLAALHGAFARPGGRYGELDTASLREWAAWEARFGIVPKPPDVGSLFDPSVLARAQARVSGTEGHGT